MPEAATRSPGRCDAQGGLMKLDTHSRRRPRAKVSLPTLPSQVLNLFAFVTGCRAKNYLQDSVFSLALFRADARPFWHTEPDKAGSLQPMLQKRSSGHSRAGIVENFAICMLNSPSEIWSNIHFGFFIPQRAAPRKGSANPPLILRASQHPLPTVTPRAPWTLQAVSSPLVGSPVEPVIPIRWEDDKPC